MARFLRIRNAIILSVLLQLALATFAAHPYDGRVFLVAGYLVAHGRSPYEPTNLASVFGSTLFSETVQGIGYPPPWGLILGISYLVSYALIPNLILYNLTIKIPVIVANVALALVIRKILKTNDENDAAANGAACFMLFNPYILYTTTMWGQFDTLSALLATMALFQLTQGKARLSAIALGASISLKLIPALLLPLLLLYQKRRGGAQSAIRYFVLAIGVTLLSLVPFIVGWNARPIIENWNIHFARVGAFSPLSLLIPFNINDIPREAGILGYLWIPSLILAYYHVSKRAIFGRSELVLSSLMILLSFSLTRAWVSEQNLNFVLLLVVLGSVSRNWRKRWLAATWLLPLMFTFLNSSPFLMFFPIVPEAVLRAASPHEFRPDLVLAGRTIVTMAWLVIGVALLKKSTEVSADLPCQIESLK